MGKGGRILCIFAPYALTIASLICIIMVGLGCTDKNNNTLNNLYFFRVNMQNFTTSPKTASEVSNLLGEEGVNLSNEQLAEAIQKVKEEADIKDFYDIGLWGYCDGNIQNGRHFNITYCSPPKAGFWFNPFQIAGVKDSDAMSLLPSDAQKTLDTYKKVTQWMFVAYIVAFVATAVELPVGVFAICSRWGSCVTTLVSSVSLLFIIAASVTSTVLYITVKHAFDQSLKPYGVTGSMGRNMFAATWLAVVFSSAASLFWLISSCCCSAHDRQNRGNRMFAEKAPHAYEPLGPKSHTPYGEYDTSYPPPLPMQSPPGNSIPMRNMDAQTYEPFRHV